MSDPQSLLDASGDAEDGGATWLADVEHSLVSDPQAWREAAAGGLTRDQAWRLLSWAESMASRIPGTGDRQLVELCAFVFSLLESSPLDRRDVMVVAMLVRRAAREAGVPWGTAVADGSLRAGSVGAGARSWLASITDETPSTHEEIGSGSLTFRRKPSDIDVDDLLRRFGKPQS